MSSIARQPWIITLLATAACSTDPDVVITRPVEAGSTEPNINPTLVNGCRAGLYCGTFEGATTDQNDDSMLEGVPIHGSIRFVLEQSLAGEFLTVSSESYLEGQTETGITFNADVIASSDGCRDGRIQASLEGAFLSVPLLGQVTGTYDATDNGFTGTWNTEIVQYMSEGTWEAALSTECP